ncbi:ABC-type transport system periplasmic substrate-binding protein (probable substrate cobalamin) [Halobacterium hubeiense]|uniref:PGF-CTERM-anchored ABC transporter substrate-binding protein n=2 Tax=Halobacterium TaxID=2239 RepID=A0AAU8CCR4_9EURY|nr:PGF-CTERM-anchored ABC transporter substrate-binding protein [Halobacterium hubeiense]CQH56069.1 ABC-type transport system periplasmic substrate-binding protein (probable substrate cobalamin) [Halobacterium hubeiense]
MRQAAPVFGVVLLLLAAVAPAAGAAAAPAGDAVANAGAQDFDCSFPVTETDASGHDVTVSEEPERVVTLNPSAAQTMWEIGASEKVVGVSQFADFLDGADEREVVTSGSPSAVNVEQVVSLDPDLVLAPNTIGNETVAQLRDANLTVYRFAAADSIESIYEKTELTGQLTGECEGAAETVSEMRDRVQTVEAAVEGEDEPSVFYDMGARFTPGPNTFIGQVIDRAGGHNIAADANTTRSYPQLSAEFIVKQDPEFLVVSALPEQLGNDSRSYIAEGSVLRNTTAFEEGNIVVVDSNHVSQPAPRVVEPMTQMAQAFHPDAYAAANATTTATTQEPTATETATETTTQTTGTTIPGFGIPAAVVAALGAALLATRRQ